MMRTPALQSLRRPATIAVLCVAVAAVSATRSWSRAPVGPHAATEPGAPVPASVTDLGAPPADARAPADAETPADPPTPAEAPGAESPAATSFVFPVAGHDRSHVISRFGDPRDGGRRPHLGIDIAAPVGTPVLAPVSGVVERTGRWGAGGRVVWLREAGSDRRYYFAHLDAIGVAPGQRVAAGYPIGTVGTTGNAVGTRPHLHFAVHERRDVLDPWAFVAAAGLGPGHAVSDDAVVLMRTRLAGAALRSAAGAGHALAVLPRHQQVTVLGRGGGYYRVNYRGRTGYIAEWLLE
jgi:murein DD-endopeptidase MepM/ murein hydrolase activator NlpD